MSTTPTPSTISLPDAPAAQRDILDAGGVACWSEPLSIDTYEPAEPDRYPLFLDRRVYQGSSGKVYPIPFTDRISRDKTPKMWQAIHIENAWVRLVLLPELGGRIHIGYDKTRNYDFFYRNNVIKPALVGLAGPWMSGGVEFNWPQHHRPATFLPMDWRIDRDDDSVTVWHSDLDPLQRMKGSHGIRLRSDSTLIEVTGRLNNRTDEPQTFLWWANVAARSHDNYQAFFPTDVHHVADHARRAITGFPRADKPYYGVDYAELAKGDNPDADRIDFYGNVKVPTSYMIVDTTDDFFGGYDHDANAGFVHWADHTIAPGKKMWTWGDGPVGHAWDRHLTDTDGPYVELMAGVFTDNQPDFSYLQPGETRRFSQYWYPIQDIGPAQQATRDAAVSLVVANGTATLGVVVTAEHADATVRLRRGNDVVGEWHTALKPGHPFTVDTTLPTDTEDFELTLDVTAMGSTLVSWTPRRPVIDPPEPAPATEPPLPADIESADELYLTGVHLSQNRHPTRPALAYFEEALRRDPLDARSNTAVGAIQYARGQYADAVASLTRATARLTARNLNPADAETSYRLGLVHERTGALDAARECFAKATWDGKWAFPAHLALARVAARSGSAEDSLAEARRAARFDSDAVAPLTLEAIALRRLGRPSDDTVAAALAIDGLDPLALHLAGRLNCVDPKTTIAVAVELARLGEFEEAIALAGTILTVAPGPLGNPVPLAHYLRATWFDALADTASANAERTTAQHADTRYAFPYGLDEYDALIAALNANDTDATASGLLGSWLLDAGRTDDAAAHLERATALGSTDPVSWRNAAVATVNTGGSLDRADEFYRGALKLSPRDPRLVFERDQLARLRGERAADRIQAIEAAGALALERDDLAVEYATLLLDQSLPEAALTVLLSRSYQPFEGGEGRVLRAFDRATLAIARRQLEEGLPVVEFLRTGLVPPESLGEGRHPADIQAERFVLLGDALAKEDDEAGAQAAWRDAAAGSGPLAVGVPACEATYWIGVAHLRLGDQSEAAAVWESLDTRATEIEEFAGKVDYFATSLPELLLFDSGTTTDRRSEVKKLRSLAAAGRALTTTGEHA